MAKGIPTPCPRCGEIIRHGYFEAATVNVKGSPVPDRDSVCLTLYPCGDMACKGTADFTTFVEAFMKAYGLS